MINWKVHGQGRQWNSTGIFYDVSSVYTCFTGEEAITKHAEVYQRAATGHPWVVENMTTGQRFMRDSYSGFELLTIEEMERRLKQYRKGQVFQ